VAITKTTTTSIKDASVEEANINICAATNTKLGADAVNSGNINNGAVTADDLASTLDLSSKTITLPDGIISFDSENYNIGLLGFKMAVNESLTVFNLVDGVVDEFNDESGTDEAEGVNDGGYCATSDFYQNNQSPLPYSAGFSMSTITEPDTSTAGTDPANPSPNCGSFGSYTVPTTVCSVNFYIWGSGGGASGNSDGGAGGAGGFTTGSLSVTPSQTLYVNAGEGGGRYDQPLGGFAFGGPVAPAPNKYGGAGGGLSGIFAASKPTYNPKSAPLTPQIYAIAGSGGGGGLGGSGGGLTARASGFSSLEQTNRTNDVGFPLPGDYPGLGGGGGSQTQGGQSGDVTENNPGAFTDCGPATGGFLEGSCRPSGNARSGAGGAGYYGGGGGASGPQGYGGGGGGSSYYGNPNVSCGATTAGTNISTPNPSPNESTGGGFPSPFYVPGTNASDVLVNGDDGYVLLTATASVGSVSNTTIVSSTFSATSVPTSTRIVVFEENIDTPTLNTDIIASVSRDGTNFTNATLSDSGYVTGSSGQRILTGQADVSGQPSGQSMRWKLQLANNIVKIHGVSLSWA